MQLEEMVERALSKPDDMGKQSEFTFREHGDGWCIFEAWSPTGEDIPLERWFDNPTYGEIVDWIAEEWREFDVDEHVELLIEGRGKNGVPGTVRELLDDAEAIQEMIHDLWKRLEKEGEAA